jgi:GNAT superfamily N-acetyltransferase
MIEEHRVRPLVKEDCRQASKIRFEAQEWGFLSSMGVEFYSKILEGTSESKWGFGIVCLDGEEKILGFVYGATDLHKYYRDILFRKGIRLACMAFMELLKQPHLIWGLLKYFTYPERIPYKNIKAEWLTMVVGKNYRNKGIAKKLTRALIDEYRRRGVTQFRSTVSSNNKITCMIHDKFKFQFIGTFKLMGERINIYRYNV